MDVTQPQRFAAPAPVRFSAPPPPSTTPSFDYRAEEPRWRQLADRLGRERGLSRYRAETLFERWRRGRAAIALAGDEIVSYVSLIPLFDATVEGRLRDLLDTAEGAAKGQPGGFELYESATGWTHRRWRRRGLSLDLRRALLARFTAPNRLFASATIGLGASRVLPALDWHLASWARYPFVSALIGMPAVDSATEAAPRARQPAGLGPYLGPHITPRGNPEHRWHDHCHLWLSDSRLAAALDRRLATMATGDLDRWRRSVAEALYRAPEEPGWKPFLFREYYGLAKP